MVNGENAIEAIVSILTLGLFALVLIPMFQVFSQVITVKGPFSFFFEIFPLFIGLLFVFVLFGGFLQVLEEFGS